MILAAPFDNSSQVKGHRRSLEQQKENLRVLLYSYLVGEQDGRL